ncbi:MAG TPA: kelch repeat-containing protein [Blastocatellia bacterium]|nr:kelch repeat-containing protein [Blastocatellia bacterium]
MKVSKKWSAAIRWLPVSVTSLMILIPQLAAFAESGTSRITGSLSESRFQQSAFLLQDGNVLIFGGLNGPREALTVTELYDPATGRWSASGELRVGRLGSAAAMLADGRVFVVGGSMEALRFEGKPKIAEIYDPASGQWKKSGKMKKGRVMATATLLGDGRVLVAGGDESEGGTYQIYDPNSQSFTAREPMPLRLHGHSATLLADGRVLIAGGATGSNFFDENDEPQARAFLFDPVFNAWSETGPMRDPRSRHKAVLLPQTGEVLVIDDNHAELYDPGTGAWRRTDDLRSTHRGASITLLFDGRVLVTGGVVSDGAGNPRVEIFSPATGTWAEDGLLLQTRFHHTATRLLDGSVLLVGGKGALQQGFPLTASAEIYTR